MEHILPKNPELELRESFGEDYDNYKIKLGNLTFLEKPRNIVAGRDFFEKKKVLYEKSKFSLTKSLVDLTPVGKNTSINRVNKYLKTFEKWDRDSIIERQKILLELSSIIWELRIID